MATAALLALVVASCAGRPPHVAPGGSGGEQGRSERIESRVVLVPDTVRGPRFPWWSADGERLLFAGTPEGSERAEILSIRPDGSDLRCLTCGVAPEVDEPLLKPIAFADGTRVAVRVGNQNPLTAAGHAILECAPSVAQCDHAELVRFVPPAAHDPAVVQDQRELRLAPDGQHAGLSQVRTSDSGEATLVALVGRLRRTPTTYELDGARVVSSRGELKSFTPDGRRVLVAVFSPGPYELANPDVISIDLATGEQERVTTAPDYDEPVELSPDGRWYVVGSGRGSGLFETVSQVRRPPLLGPALDPLTATLFAHHRSELLDGWVVRTGSEARGETGQRIPAPEGGYDSRPIWNWRPDGTAITYWEGRGSGFETDPVDTRLVVAELVDRRPARPRPANPIATPTWAPPVAGFVPESEPLPVSRDGRRRGAVTVEITEVAGGIVVEVSYHGFSDDGAWVIDGTERADRRGGTTTYTADLTLSGRHEGFLRADAVISLAGIEGEITSSVDGRQLTLPPPDGGG
jgi:hypothetical protein